MRFWDKNTQYRSSLRELPRSITLSTFSTGIVTFIMVLTVPAPVIYQAATEAGWTLAQIGSWFFAVLAAGAVMQLVLVLGYRQPIAAGASTLATAFLVHALPGVSLEEAIGAYLLCGVLIVLLAFTGVARRLLDATPQAIVMGMLAGALLRFEIGALREIVLAPSLVIPVVMAWLAASRLLSRVVPPVAVALTVGVVLAMLLAPQTGDPLTLGLTLPEFYSPRFTLEAFLSLTVPLLLLVSAQNASAIGALWSQNYRPPVNAITLCTGVFTILTALMGAQGVSTGAQRSAVAGDPSVHKDPSMRYGALIVDAVCVLVSAAFAMTVVGVFALLPGGMIRVIAALAMLPVVVQALRQAVGGVRYRFGGFFALVIAASDVQWFGVSSVFWALVLAPILSLVIDRDEKPVA